LSVLTAVRAAWGTLLLLAPASVLDLVSDGNVDRSARAVARVLGARELAQAMLIGPDRPRSWVLVGAAVDAAHASTMVTLAVLRADRRRLATGSALAAGSFARAGLGQARLRR